MGSLTLIQHAVLVGSLLGDGTLRRQKGKLNALFEVNHSAAAKDYVDWKYSIFQEFVITPPRVRKGNDRRVAYRFTTRSLPVFTEYFLRFYRSGKKRVPSNLEGELDELALAVWFMDDGSRSRSAVYLNTQQFILKDQERLRKLLFCRFGISSNLNRDKQYFRIRLTTEGSSILVKLVKQYVVDFYRYKLGDDPVTTDPKGEA